MVKRLLLWGISGSFLLILMMGACFAYLIHWSQQPGSLEQPLTFEVKKGAAFQSIAQELQQVGVIDQPYFLQALAVIRQQHHRIQAGEYRLAAHISPQSVLDQLVQGSVITYSLTIPEGKTVAEIAAILRKDARLSGVMPQNIAEGSLMPDTYHFQKGDKRADLVARMQVQMRQSLEHLWAARAGNLPFSTIEEALTLASIVEKETGVKAERARVAAVFINRLRKGMKLQADPTVIYALEQQLGKPLDRMLTRKDWQLEHPYNTYYIEGLPPGPIANPGRAALRAVLQPADTDELFFVATGDGGHFFAKTYAEHKANIRRYQQTRALNQELSTE